MTLSDMGDTALQDKFLKRRRHIHLPRDATLEEKTTTADLTCELGGLTAFTGRLLTIIRAHTWNMAREGGDLAADIRAVREYADATHNLFAFGLAVDTYSAGDGSDAATAVDSCD